MHRPEPQPAQMVEPPSRESVGTPTEAGDADRAVSLRQIWQLRWAMVGQVLTFSAMVLPIALRQSDRVVALAFATAVALLLANVSTLAFANVYPVLVGRKIPVAAMLISVASLTLVSLLVLASSHWEGSLGLARGTLVAAAALLWTQGLYFVLMAMLVRRHDEAGLRMSRLIYGLAVFAATLVACLLPLGKQCLVYANAGAYLVTVSTLGIGRRLLPTSTELPSIRQLRRIAPVYVRRTSSATLAGVASGWAFFLSGAALPGLGIYGGPWAIVNRLCGGYGTLLQAVLVPPMEARLSGAVRRRDHEAFAKARRVALQTGIGVAALALASSLGLAVYGSLGRTAIDSWLPGVSVAALLFWTPQLVTTPINRVPNFLRRDRARLIWDVCRSLGITVAFLAASGITRILVMGVVISALTPVLVLLSRYRRRESPTEAHAVSQAQPPPSSATRTERRGPGIGAWKAP